MTCFSSPQTNTSVNNTLIRSKGHGRKPDSLIDPMYASEINHTLRKHKAIVNLNQT